MADNIVAHSMKGNKGGDLVVGHNFRVDFGTKEIERVFKIDGVGDKSEVVSYGEGVHHVGNTPVRPGLTTTDPVTIERLFAGDGVLAELWKDIQDATTEKDGERIPRQTLTITMLNDAVDPKALWEIELRDAWMSSYQGPTLDHRSSEPATESATFVYESMKIKKA